MNWNHRFVIFPDVFSDDTPEYIELCEVYYDEAGNLIGYSRPHLVFDDIEGVKEFCARIARASELPLLHEDDFPEDEDDEDDAFFCDPPTED